MYLSLGIAWILILAPAVISAYTGPYGVSPDEPVATSTAPLSQYIPSQAYNPPYEQPYGPSNRESTTSPQPSRSTSSILNSTTTSSVVSSGSATETGPVSSIDTSGTTASRTGGFSIRSSESISFGTGPSTSRSYPNSTSLFSGTITQTVSLTTTITLSNGSSILSGTSVVVSSPVNTVYSDTLLGSSTKSPSTPTISEISSTPASHDSTSRITVHVTSSQVITLTRTTTVSQVTVTHTSASLESSESASSIVSAISSGFPGNTSLAHHTGTAPHYTPPVYSISLGSSPPNHSQVSASTSSIIVIPSSTPGSPIPTPISSSSSYSISLSTAGTGLLTSSYGNRTGTLSSPTSPSSNTPIPQFSSTSASTSSTGTGLPPSSSSHTPSSFATSVVASSTSFFTPVFNGTTSSRASLPSSSGLPGYASSSSPPPPPPGYGTTPPYGGNGGYGYRQGSGKGWSFGSWRRS